MNSEQTEQASTPSSVTPTYPLTTHPQHHPLAHPPVFAKTPTLKSRLQFEPVLHFRDICSLFCARGHSSSAVCRWASIRSWRSFFLIFFLSIIYCDDNTPGASSSWKHYIHPSNTLYPTSTQVYPTRSDYQFRVLVCTAFVHCNS